MLFWHDYLPGKKRIHGGGGIAMKDFADLVISKLKKLSIEADEINNIAT